MFNYTNKLALVTGGSSGIGLAISKALARQGTNVFILARNLELLENARIEIEKVKTEVEQGKRKSDQITGIIPCNVADPSQIKQCLQEFVSKHGVPDVLINCAGVAKPGEFLETDLDVFEWMINTNYLGMVNVIRQILPGMVTRKSGLIINFSSVAGFVSLFYGYTAYCGSKFAVRGFSDALRLEVKPHNVQVSVVFPADVDTPQLAYETKHQTGMVKAYHDTIVRIFGGKTLSPDIVALEILKSAARGKYIILPGSDAKFGYTIVGLLGNLLYPILDLIYKVAEKNYKK